MGGPLTESVKPTSDRVPAPGDELPTAGGGAEQGLAFAGCDASSAGAADSLRAPDPAQPRGVVPGHGDPFNQGPHQAHPGRPSRSVGTNPSQPAQPQLASLVMP